MTRVQFFAVTDSGLQALLVPQNSATFSVLYAGLPLGVYSAMRTFEHNKFLHLGDHLARTQRSLAVLGWDYELDEARLRKLLHKVCSEFPAEDMRVRFDVLAQAAPQLGTVSRELIALEPLVPIPPHFYEEGVAVDIAATLSRQRPLAKTATFAQNRPYQVGQKQAAYEQLMVNAKGQILEGTLTNFWAVRNGVVWTATEDVLEGVTRKIILSLLPELAITLNGTAVDVSDLPLISEAALSSSSRALLPVVSIAGQTVGNGHPGPVVKRILAAYNEYVSRSIATAI